LYNRCRAIRIWLRDYSLFAPKGDDFFIYMADGKMLHGGLADRLYGMLNAYAFCKIKNIAFRINFIYPFDLQLFLKPNKYDWTIKKERISYNFVHSSVMVKIQEYGWHKKNINNKQIHFYCNTKNIDKINSYHDCNFSYHDLFNELFNPSESLQAELDDMINDVLKKTYIAFHFRFKNSLGDFKEASYPELPDDKKIKLLDLCFKSIVPFIKSGKKVFLTSDSKLFLDNMIKRSDEIYFIPGDTIIMDYKVPFAVYKKAFLDFFILGNASKILSARGDGLFESGFSLFASQILNTEFQIISVDE
jgi:hypothetical protein